MIDPRHKLPVVQQARLLDLSRSSVYYLPKPTPDADLRLMRRMDELHLEYPFAGARMLRDMLLLEGHEVGRKHVGTLMRKMGIEAIYRKAHKTAGVPAVHVGEVDIENDQVRPDGIRLLDSLGGRSRSLDPEILLKVELPGKRLTQVHPAHSTRCDA